MSGTRKVFVGGTIASLVLSLAIPVTNSSGLSASAEAQAGVGPKFSKPWSYKNTSKKSVKSYPIPDDLKFQREDLPSSSAPAETSSEPGESSDELSVQQASARKTRKAESERPEKEGNVFTRLFDKITGGNEEEQPAQESYPVQEMTTQPTENFFEPEPVAETPVSDSPVIALPTPEAPVAEIILPPQPQPNLLPGIENAPPEAMQPAITEGVKTEMANDPFPLPPLPAGFDKEKPAVVKSAASASGLLLPPLPDQSSEPATTTAQVDTAAPETSDDSLTPESTSPSVVAMPPLPGFEPEPAPTAEMDLMQEALSESAPEETLEAPTADSASVADTGSRKKGELETNLPLAPSSREDLSAWKDREPEEEQVDLAEEQNTPAYRGWRSRDQALPQEPNALDIPETARPAEIPAEQSASASPQEVKYRKIAERGERTGFKGFCPVALRDHLELVDASPEYRTEFEGQVYYFANQECLALFVNDPIRYVPAQGGIDLVKYLEEGSEQPGRLDFAVWYQDRLFLFATQETLEEFRSEPARFVEGE